MGVAIRHAHTWVTTGEGTITSPAAIDTSLRAVRVQMAQMEELCGVTGRDFTSLRRLVVTGPLLASCLESVEAFRDAAGRYEEAGASDLVVHWPRSEEPYAADVATFERIFSA
jgi:hypothetical protein